MSKVKHSLSVTHALNNLAEALMENEIIEGPVSIKTAPTEDLLIEMQEILNELKTRVVPETIPLSELPVGAKVRDSKTAYYGVPIVWLVADRGYYGDSLTTLLSERILTFKAFDAAEPDNPDRWRAEYGNNSYQVSNIGLWLNSDKQNWFTPLHAYDQAPTEDYVSSRPYANESGFMSNFSQEFKSQINDSVEGKIFLLSAGEVGFTEEKAMALFENEEFRKAKPTKECVLIDGEGDEHEADWWWLRTPNAGSSGGARIVNSSGALDYNIAYNGYGGARPALNLSSEIRVKSKPDENGIHEIVWGC